ncbi:MAG: hypothetical protein JNL70_07165 [Saprospiraceae bacterium]|nr:hypothetical protein [Saprospiraceae bacterium]
MKAKLTTMPADIKPLSKAEQTQTKGGILLYCEEKRRNFLGMSYTTMQWNVANDGSLWPTIQF